MSGLQDTLIANAIALPALMVAFWLVSIPLRDVSIVDIAWGLAIALAGWIAFAVGDGDSGRALLMVVLVTLWAAQLAGYIGLRKLRYPGEDPRYTAMRERSERASIRRAQLPANVPGAKVSSAFVWVSLGKVFLLQAALGWVIALVLAGSGSYHGELGWLDLVGVAVWLVGIFFEAVGDAQLLRFKRDPANKRKVMKTGLWRYTRHPNYFGEFCVWWGFYLIALSAGAWWTVIAPLIVTALVTKVSGAAHLEKTTLDKRPGYKEYAERTSGFFPRRPKKI